jgi:hypothetical protein
MDRYWFLTWTTYGSWLPGDARGFVSPVRDGDGPEVVHNQPGTPYDADMPGLRKTAQHSLKGPPVYLTGVPGDPDPSDVLGDFKSYGSRALNRRWGKPQGGTWWTESGSRRRLPDDAAIRQAVNYVNDQFRPLVVWVAENEREP